MGRQYWRTKDAAWHPSHFLSPPHDTHRTQTHAPFPPRTCPTKPPPPPFSLPDMQPADREIVHSHTFSRFLTPFRAEWDPKDPTERAFIIGRWVKRSPANVQHGLGFLACLLSVCGQPWRAHWQHSSNALNVGGPTPTMSPFAWSHVERVYSHVFLPCMLVCLHEFVCVCACEYVRTCADARVGGLARMCLSECVWI
jgi:hypothetical protein